MHKRTLGTTGLSVTPICVGTSPLGSFPSQYGYEVQTEQAVSTLIRVFESSINFIDTSNNYFDAERRIGLAIREYGGLPEGFVLATKVDPVRGSVDFSAARTRTSVQESLERLGVDHLELVYLHDPELISFDEAMGPDGPVEALVAMQREGLIDHLGVAGGPIELMRRYVATGLFEVAISHNRFTLVDQSAGALIDETEKRGVAMVNGAPYGGGMLIHGPDDHPNYAYGPVDEVTRNRVRAMQHACERHGIPLAAAALQFSMKDPRIASTIVGMSAPQRVEQTLDLVQTTIPDELWAELDTLATPGRQGVLESASD